MHFKDWHLIQVNKDLIDLKEDCVLFTLMFKAITNFEAVTFFIW